VNPGNMANGWERPPEYDDPPDPPPPDDCLGCGRCEACAQRSAAFAAEMNDGWPDFDDPDECEACHGTGWQDSGIIAIECPECGGTG